MTSNKRGIGRGVGIRGWELGVGGNSRDSGGQRRRFANDALPCISRPESLAPDPWPLAADPWFLGADRWSLGRFLLGKNNRQKQGAPGWLVLPPLGDTATVLTVAVLTMGLRGNYRGVTR